VIIPAHNEAQVVGRCLRSLLDGARPGEFEVVVVANGCTDDTAATARRAADELGARSADVTVLERREPGKTGALNTGDAAAATFPRIYLDADVELSAESARLTAALLHDDAPASPLAAAPRPRVVGRGLSRIVRWHYEAWQELPVIRDRYVGSGVYAVSARGHARIAPFPDVIADDHYVRRSFAAHERASVSATFDLHPATTVRAHVRRATRARAGNTSLDGGTASVDTTGLAAETAPRGARALVGLLRHPRMWHRVAAFVVLAGLVRASAVRSGPDVGWNHDASSRTADTVHRSTSEVVA